MGYICPVEVRGDPDLVYIPGQIQHVRGNWVKKRKPKAGSYKKHWIYKSKKPFPAVCQMEDCNNEAELGAHVYIRTFEGYEDEEESADWDYYILPCCQRCNQDPRLTEGWHEVKDEAVVAYITK